MIISLILVNTVKCEINVLDEILLIRVHSRASE